MVTVFVCGYTNKGIEFAGDNTNKGENVKIDYIRLILFKMTLEYKIAKNSTLNSEDIIKRILLVIEQRKYGILEITDRSVEFNDHSGGFIGNWEYVSRMKKGKFEIINNGDNSIVTFDYLPIPMSEYIGVAFACLLFAGLGIINNFYFACFILIPFLGQLIYKRYNLKNIANKCLTMLHEANLVQKHISYSI